MQDYFRKVNSRKAKKNERKQKKNVVRFGEDDLVETLSFPHNRSHCEGDARDVGGGLAGN